MSASHTPALPQGPWFSILLPALLGDDEASQAAFRRCSPIAGRERSRLKVIRARAAATLGDHATCSRLLSSGLQAGVTESFALAVHLHPKGVQTALDRFPSLPDGEAADLAADMAARLLVDDKPGEAADMVRRGLLACPDHGELGRWRRFLTQTPLPLAVQAAKVHHAGEIPSESTIPAATSLLDTQNAADTAFSWERLRTDVAGLLPSAASGWFPPDRVGRKLLSGAFDNPAPLGTGLRRLQDAGCCHRSLASEEDFLALSPIHPIVDLEILADRLESLLGEGRPAHATARHLWFCLRDMPLNLMERGATFLASLALEHAGLADVALHAIQKILRRSCYTGEQPLPRREYWRALRAEMQTLCRCGDEPRRQFDRFEGLPQQLALALSA